MFSIPSTVFQVRSLYGSIEPAATLRNGRSHPLLLDMRRLSHKETALLSKGHPVNDGRGKIQTQAVPADNHRDVPHIIIFLLRQEAMSSPRLTQDRHPEYSHVRV